jgi:uncharacterized flavoprotein (TIGR03862 family)
MTLIYLKGLIGFIIFLTLTQSVGFLNMKKQIAIIGGGAAALMLATHLDEEKFDVVIYEKNAALGRKFLVAGDGGFNLTHSENIDSFISRYAPADFFQAIINQFSNTDLREWLKAIGIDTFVGTSKRVYPTKGIKPIAVLSAIMHVLKQKNVTIKTKHCWKGWNNNQLLFNVIDTANENSCIEFKTNPDIVVFALGGASWSVTGSDGSWADYFKQKNIYITPFMPSNCAFQVNWNEQFIKTSEGQSLKNIVLTCDGAEKAGELVITKFGLEGGAIYALSGVLRKQLEQNKTARLFVDLKPQWSILEIEKKLNGRGNKSISDCLKNTLNLPEVVCDLLKTGLNKEEYMNTGVLCQKIKNYPLLIIAMAPIDEAISTVGGVALSEINADFELLKLPKNYVIGEMLDWDAPTGGYLLQACFSMGYSLATKLNSTQSSVL